MSLSYNTVNRGPSFFLQNSNYCTVFIFTLVISSKDLIQIWIFIIIIQFTVYSYHFNLKRNLSFFTKAFSLMPVSVNDNINLQIICILIVSSSPCLHIFSHYSNLPLHWFFSLSLYQPTSYLYYFIPRVQQQLITFPTSSLPRPIHHSYFWHSYYYLINLYIQ